MLQMFSEKAAITHSTPTVGHEQGCCCPARGTLAAPFQLQEQKCFSSLQKPFMMHIGRYSTYPASPHTQRSALPNGSCPKQPPGAAQMSFRALAAPSRACMTRAVARTTSSYSGPCTCGIPE